MQLLIVFEEQFEVLAHDPSRLGKAHVYATFFTP